MKKAVEVEWDSGQTTLASAKYLKSINKNESVELDEATDFRKGDTVHQVGSKLKGTVLHKGNRDEIIVKFGTISKSIPSSQLRLVESVEHENCGTPDCCGTCDTDINEAMGPLTPAQIAKLKKEYGGIEKINVTGPAYKKVKAWIAKMDKEDLMTLAKAKVKWLSQFAASELRLTHNVKMKAGEYMESVTLKNFFEVRESRDAAKDLYFNTYSAAIEKAINDTFKKHKLEVDSDDYYQKVNMGPGKPGRGKTTRHTLDLVDTRTGKPSRKKLQIQVYNRETDKNPYELNFYVS
jgi:hypothetical protein